jgi:Na+/H+-dicarboxylate symporter
MSLSAKIFLGLGLGIATGIFLGEITAPLKAVGTAYVQLLQMAVLPYIMITLMSGLGKLKYQEAVRLSIRVGSLLLLIWALTFALLYLLPLSFPNWQSASFFSSTLLEQPQRFNFLEFIPSNPFHSMANNIVPAVVLFSIAVGLALMGIEGKGSLIAAFDILEEALKRVTKFVSKLTPFGIFAIAANTAGTMNMEQLSRLQVYIITDIVAALGMTFGLLPALIMLLTPLGYREIVWSTKDALLMAFATDNLLIVIPMLTDHGKELLRKGAGASAESESSVDVIVPISFNFPNIGRLLQLLFILFAAWFTKTAITLSGYVNLTVSGLLSFFGKPVAAMPFLLDLLHLPADMLQLYFASGIFVGQFGTLASAMHLFALAVLGGFAMSGALRIQWKRLVPVTALTLGLVAGTVVGLRAYFSLAVENAYDKDKIVAQMKPLFATGPAKLYKSAPPVPTESSSSGLKRIHARGVIRVGYLEDNRPASFINGRGELVGLDVEMAHILARSLGVNLEFVPVDRNKMLQQLNEGYCDIVMSGMVLTPERAEAASLSAPYMEQTLAFVVEDYRRSDFSSRESIRKLKSLKLAILDVPYFISFVRERLPKAELVIVNSAEEFFATKGKTVDGFVYSAEGGSAWSLLYPEYAVVIPPPPRIALPMSYAMARGDRELVDYVNALVELKKGDGTYKKLYNYWVLGQFAADTQPRWSVIRNLLHWVD